MNRARALAAPIALAALAPYIWLRDRTWLADPEDVLPLVAALPLFWLLGRPWRLAPSDGSSSNAALVGAAAALALGSPTGLTLPLAAGWTLLLWWWLAPRLPVGERPRIRRLLVLPLMAFPWVTLDGQPVGFAFRLSGAITTGAFYDLLGYPVTRDGTALVIGGQGINVEAACAGLNTLQSLLVMGTLAAAVTLGRHRRYWLCLPLLVAAAWIGNTARIIAISGIALAWGPEAASGRAHGWSGWIVLMLTFFGTVLVFEALRPRKPAAAATAPPARAAAERPA
jgi:exosortase